MKTTAQADRGRGTAGFTLIEVMITVAIVAILAAVALPSYTSHVARARRADARAQLQLATQYMQRFYAANDSYEVDRAGNQSSAQMPANLKRSPADGTQLYALTVVASDAVRGYTLTMAPVSGTSAANDDCGSYILTNTGTRKNSTAKSVDECWK